MCDGGIPSLRFKAFQGCSTSSGVQNWAPHNLEYIGTKHHLMFCKGCGTYWERLGELLTEFYGVGVGGGMPLVGKVPETFHFACNSVAFDLVQEIQLQELKATRL